MTHAYNEMKAGDVFYYPVGYVQDPDEWTVTRACNRSQTMTVCRSDADTGLRSVSLEENTWDRTIEDGVIVTHKQLTETVTEEVMFQHTLAGTVTSLLVGKK